jgi:hypothetical protein
MARAREHIEALRGPRRRSVAPPHSVAATDFYRRPFRLPLRSAVVRPYDRLPRQLSPLPREQLRVGQLGDAAGVGRRFSPHPDRVPVGVADVPRWRRTRPGLVRAARWPESCIALWDIFGRLGLRSETVWDTLDEVAPARGRVMTARSGPSPELHRDRRGVARGVHP